MTKGKIIRWFLMGVVPLVAAVAGADHYVKGLRYVDTENAYIRAEVITVSSEIDGRISFVNAEENAWVDAGAELLGIESSPLEAAVTGAEADLASARLTVAALHARYREGRAEVGAAIERVRFLETEVATPRTPGCQWKSSCRNIRCDPARTGTRSAPTDDTAGNKQHRTGGTRRIDRPAGR